MSAAKRPGVLARAQSVVQSSRAIPELAHRTFGRFSEVGTEPFLDPADLPWTALLEEHYPAIRAEAERVLQVRDALPNFQDIAPDQIDLSDDDQWKTFWFVGYDVWDDPNCLRCPATATVLRALPGVTPASSPSSARASGCRRTTGPTGGCCVTTSP